MRCTSVRHRMLGPTLVLFLALAYSVAVRAGEPAATPYRPTVSTPTALSEPGWLEVELGGQRTHTEESPKRHGLSYALKYAISPDWGLRVAGEAWVREQASDGSSLGGVGDTAIILKRRFARGEDMAFGVEAGVNVPTAKSELGSGNTDYLITGIFSANLGAYHYDLNLGATRLGRMTVGEGRTQIGWAASLSRPLDDRWGLAGELSGTYRKGVSNTDQALVAINYNYSKRLILDSGVALGLNRASPDWSLFAGLTLLIGKLP